jgi:hypothetical protein
MADITLSNGREITFDLTRLTVREWRSLLDPDQPREKEDQILERVAGLEEGAIMDMNMIDYKRLSKAFLKAITTPVSDPKEDD